MSEYKVTLKIEGIAHYYVEAESREDAIRLAELNYTPNPWDLKDLDAVEVIGAEII